VHLGEATDASVLVLSFTRAVVAEIRRRAGEAGGARITPSTIDGYAARIVLGAGEELAGDFDRTVARAAVLLEESPERVPRPDHVLVDEVQDLVEPRLGFVLLLLERSNSGFTAFGDPRQAIYDFGGEGRGRKGADAVRDLPNVQELGLTETHRAKVAQLLGGRERTGSDVMAEARPVSSVGQLKLLMNTGKAVLLTRTNGEALAMADILAEAGVVATVRQGADDRSPPEWIARFASAAPRDRWTRKRAMATLSELGDNDTRAPDEMWRVLRRLAAADGEVSLERLRLAVARPASYDDFSPTESGSISTIHRAKGLEWDQVVVLQPVPSEDVSDEEERVLFVAATRARKELWRLSRPDFGGRLTAGAEGRWELRSWPGRPLRMEIRTGDVDVAEPFAATENDGRSVQTLLAGVRPGTPVLLRRDGGSYVAEIEGRPSAVTTVAFGDAVGRRWPRRPTLLAGARVLRTRTVAGDPATSARAGLAETGLWVGLDLIGLVRPSDTREATDGRAG
jgi:hypothetical protein